MTSGHSRSDALPEHRTYKDTGCSYSPTCLSCNLPQCIFDRAPHIYYTKTRIALFRFQTYLRQGLSAKQAANRLRISHRTMYRYLYITKHDPTGPHLLTPLT